MNHPLNRALRRRGLVLAAPLLAALVGLAGCGGSNAPASGGSPAAAGDRTSAGATLDAKGCITDFDADTDYYPDKQQLQYTSNVSLSYQKSYQVLTVKEPFPGGKPETYVLQHCGAPKPALTGDLAGAQVIKTPVTSLFSGSTTHLPSLEALGELDVITGVGSKAYISSKAAKARADSSDVVEYAAAGTADAEKIVEAKPDVLVTAGTDDPAYATVKKAGVPVLGDADYLEADPLGRAEWIKVFAALTGTEAKATSTFDQIASDYQAAVKVAADADPVSVLLSQPYQGVWSVPAGGSYAGQLTTEAGGRWPWQSAKSAGSVDTDLETVFARSGKAKIWITSNNWKTKSEALKEESRFAQLAAMKNGGQVWAPSKQVNAAGGNNFYELGVLRPDLTVTDLIAILHPDLEPDHTFTFYQQVK